MHMSTRHPSVDVTCTQCGKVFRRRHYHAQKTQRPFCGFRCYGKWQKTNPHPQARPQKAKWLQLQCSHCGKAFERPKWKRVSRTMPFCSRPCFHAHAREHFRGSKNPGWKGGNPKWYGVNWGPARRKALERDGHRCCDCGAAKDLVVHHLREFCEFDRHDEAHALDNLRTLCRSCHRVAHN
jgi:endogenous inhibitor of DNA gyrase (YacG/DUF329 family)